MTTEEYLKAGKFAALIEKPKALILAQIPDETVYKTTSSMVAVIKENNLSLEQADLLLEIVRGQIHKIAVIK